MALDEPNAQDVQEINGLEVLFDVTVRAYADNQVLDYVTSPRGEGFVIKPVGGSCC